MRSWILLFFNPDKSLLIFPRLSGNLVALLPDWPLVSNKGSAAILRQMVPTLLCAADVNEPWAGDGFPYKPISFAFLLQTLDCNHLTACL